MLPGWQAFDKNLYYFSDMRKSWKGARDDCLARHTADLVSCKYGEEQVSTRICVTIFPKWVFHEKSLNYFSKMKISCLGVENG